MVLKRITVYILSILVFIFLLGFATYPFLSKTNLVESDVMVLEGWVKEGTMDVAVFEFAVSNYRMLITTGGPVPREDIVMPYSSELRFHFPDTLETQKADSLDYSIIKLTAFGSQLDGIYPHFKVSINDSVIGEDFTTESAEDYTFRVNLREKDIHTLAIKFDNDGASKNGDRNFVFRSATINNKKISPFSKNVAIYRKKDKKIISEKLYKYFPEKTALALEQKGIDKEKIIAVPTPFVERDRTYESAVTLREFLISNYPEIKSMNIVTQGVHARRSWMMYKKAFGSDFKIGVMAADNEPINSSNWYKSSSGVFLVLKEFGKYLYAQFWFYPFG